ncbi:hypothetical protein FA95DRAFT_886176 [Auriscalpium vulgare]|uniref:Uncharacterized protein n=1 Tax=Auriscalpium vulgare TaxID=40419 RepID=A0ACB8R8V5_9AGAM|nr:hypothetical protein FA95DRAFT_886176 [Auriscalpium vulgare]
MPSRTSPPPTHGPINCLHSETCDIREAPGLHPVANVGRRVLRTIAFEALQPVRQLRGDEFVNAWLDCVRCHRHLWKQGVQQRGPSLSNLTYCRKDGAAHGVLNDWDLASIEEEHADRYLDRTGSIPFMPLGLLDSPYWAGDIERTYYHDLESFIWVLAFVFLSFGEDGKRLKTGPRPADAWETGDYEQCYKEKAAFLNEKHKGLQSYNSKPPAAWEKEWPLANDLLLIIIKQRRREEDAVLFHQRVDPIPEDAHYKEVLTIMKRYGYSNYVVQRLRAIQCADLGNCNIILAMMQVDLDYPYLHDMDRIESRCAFPYICTMYYHLAYQ